MKYDLPWLQQRMNHDPQPASLFFWGHRRSRDGRLTASCLSQWWQNDFQKDGLTYQTAEHWMMAEKARLFDDIGQREAIIRAENPEIAKKLGRQVRGFDEAQWQEHREDIVIRGNFLKFSQNAHLKTFLINTGNRILVEVSPYDRIWGIGLGAENPGIEDPLRWRGLNLLGFALMEVRELLIKAP